jgi:hypothetical protein
MRCNIGLKHSLTNSKEFGIEMPDKDADGIHSGMILQSQSQKTD